MTAEPKYGPWIAWNATPDSTCPPDAVGKMGQVQLASQTRVQAKQRRPEKLNTFRWDLLSDFDVIAYRVLIEPVRGEEIIHRSLEGQITHRLTIQTDGNAPIPGTYTGPDGAVIKVEAV